jgi:hypothetical protein
VEEYLIAYIGIAGTIRVRKIKDEFLIMDVLTLKYLKYRMVPDSSIVVNDCSV